MDRRAFLKTLPLAVPITFSGCLTTAEGDSSISFETLLAENRTDSNHSIKLVIRQMSDDPQSTIGCLSGDGNWKRTVDTVISANDTIPLVPLPEPGVYRTEFQMDGKVRHANCFIFNEDENTFTYVISSANVMFTVS